MDLITHLYVTYADITNADWLANDKRFQEAYAPTDPIEVVWKNINNEVAYARFRNQVIDNTYPILLNMGVFADDFRERNKCSAGNKTIPHLKGFSPPPTERDTSQFIMRQVPPYGAVHNATANLDDRYLHKETVDAI